MILPTRLCATRHTLPYSPTPTVTLTRGMIIHWDPVEICVCILRDLLLQTMFKFLFRITHLVSPPSQRVIHTGISMCK
uniref:Uncharacterized protein n=1 Tax=Arundo donax TaxID=35708 RepID=A0A0A9GSM6_ARUDO